MSKHKPHTRIRICHVCSGHTSDDSRVFHKECRSLAQEGYEVHLIATDPHPEPHEVEQVIIHPLPPSGSRISRLSRRWTVADIAADLAADLYHVHEPELLGPVLARVSGAPVVFDVHESYLDVLGQRPWIPSIARPLAKWLWARMERNLVRKCHAIVTVTDPIAERYAKYHARVELIRNFPDWSSFESGDDGDGYRDRHACVFAGTLKEDRNLRGTVLALGLLRRRGLVVPLWLAGRWESEEYKRDMLALADSEGVKDQVQYFGVLSHQHTVALESRAGIGLVNLLPIQNSLNALPIKLFECMALGLPIIYSNFPLLQTYLGGRGVGLAVDPENPATTAEAIELLVSEPDTARRMGQAGMRLVGERFNWRIERRRLFQLYRDILAPVQMGQIA